ncbi:hypothetical protein [Salinibacterium sp. M195]|uniref:hypothetical protein n=1 Tax=Salinibacterium sp. M195 TaxID=2583374 RepID=UPI001C6350EE|nr:hypothetical protein [Salinibacterium sp. M195]QYH35683.1 hypothetical protein FFT87_06785 [Salinibacterium sp. M195]
MQWETVSIVLLLVLVVALVIFRKVFNRRMKNAAGDKGREMGLSMEARIKLADLSKLSRALVIADVAAAPAIIDEGLAKLKRVTPGEGGRWNLRVIQPDDVVFESTNTEHGVQLRVISGREGFGNVQGGGDWLKVLQAVGAAAAARGVATTETTITLDRSAAPIEGDHVWTLVA